MASAESQLICPCQLQNRSQQIDSGLPIKLKDLVGVLMSAQIASGQLANGFNQHDSSLHDKLRKLADKPLCAACPTLKVDFDPWFVITIPICPRGPPSDPMTLYSTQICL